MELDPSQPPLKKPRVEKIEFTKRLLESLRTTSLGTEANVELYNQSCLLLVDLKQNCRDVQQQIEDIKQKNDKQQDELSDKLLAVQNLKYEKYILEHEIRKIQQIREQRPTSMVNFVSEAEFMEKAPQNLRDFDTEHQKTLNLLTFELDERKRFEVCNEAHSNE